MLRNSIVKLPLIVEREGIRRGRGLGEGGD